MKNKIIIPALLLISVSLYSQVLPIESISNCTIRPIQNHKGFQFASGYIYIFEENTADENNIQLAELFEIAHNKYKEKKISEALNDFEEFIDIPISPKGIYARELNYRKHDACGMIAGLFLEKKKYNKALEYTELFHGVYPDYSTCGHGAFAAYFWYLNTKTDCLIGLGKNDSAFVLMEEYLFIPHFYEDHRQAIKKMVTLLLQKYGKDFLRQSLLSAKITKNRDIYVTFMDKDYRLGIELDNKISKDYTNGKISEQDFHNHIQEAFKQHYTYKLIMEN